MQIAQTMMDLIIEMFLFSVAGWIMEVTLKAIQYHRFINRGFLIGPYCPIYGCGVVGVTLIVGGIIGYEGTYAETFLAGFVVCGALEYFVSWYMEKLFHARWWDYSTKPMNLNGRIWIGNLILFGIGSVAIIKFIDPLVFVGLAGIPVGVKGVFTSLIVVVLVADNVVSHILMNIVKKEIDGREEDNTEEVSKKVHELLRNRKLLERRINEAYPNLQARPERLTSQLKSAKQEVKAAAKTAKQELAKVAGGAKEGMEAAASELKVAEQSVITGSEERLARSREELRLAKEKLQVIQEKLTYHKK